MTRRFVGVLLPKLFPLLRASSSGLDEREKRTLQGLLQRVIVAVDENA